MFVVANNDWGTCAQHRGSTLQSLHEQAIHTSQRQKLFRE
jgi:hypothetical protein